MKALYTQAVGRIAIAFGTAMLLAGTATMAAETGDQARPNIVFILADDLGWRDVGFNESTLADTPALDQLAREGMRFSHAYAPAPICSASRAAILTGRSPARLQFEFVTRHPNAAEPELNRPLQPPPATLDLPLSEVTIPEVIGNLGYESAFIGKWHVSAHHDGQYLKWSPTHGPLAQGFDHEVFEFGMHPYNKAKEPAAPDSFASGEFPEDELTAQAIQFIREADHQTPFFLYLSHFYVHEPIRNQVQWLTDKYTERMGSSEGRERVEYAASIEILDHHVGSLLRAIDESGQRDNTLVIFFSDNGGDPRFTRHAPLRGHKWTLYEGGVRVPMVVRWPGVVEEGVTCDTSCHRHGLAADDCRGRGCNP
jgi:arylsulfatase A